MIRVARIRGTVTAPSREQKIGSDQPSHALLADSSGMESAQPRSEPIQIDVTLYTLLLPLMAYAEARNASITSMFCGVPASHVYRPGV